MRAYYQWMKLCTESQRRCMKKCGVKASAIGSRMPSRSAVSNGSQRRACARVLVASSHVKTLSVEGMSLARSRDLDWRRRRLVGTMLSLSCARATIANNGAEQRRELFAPKPSSLRL
ncbi:unnamed protein product [Colias eurytheme]|nr:unnamed protein product [Colias eurytheme]